jgi:RND superfamily putative drug exporter
MAERFPGQAGNPIEIIIPNTAATDVTVTKYMSELAGVDGVVVVNPPKVYGADLRIIAIHSMLPRSPEAQKLIHDIRALDEPAGTLVGGVAADYTDSQDGIANTLPLALGCIVITVLIFLFLFTGSIILPI